MRSRIFRHAFGVMPNLFVIAYALIGCAIGFLQARFSQHRSKRSHDHDAAGQSACVIGVVTVPI